MAISTYMLDRSDLRHALGSGSEWAVFGASSKLKSSCNGKACAWKVANRYGSVQSLKLVASIPPSPLLSGLGETPSSPK